MDRFHELSAFIAVAEARGFSAASRHTGISQPAISKAIAALEKRLGVPLFNRSTRNVSLTDQGQRYYERVRPFIDEMDDADSELTNSVLNVSGLVRIAAASTFGRLHVLPLIPDLLSLYPGLEVDLILSDFMRDMVEDRVDLAIRVGAVSEPDAVVRRVAGTSLACVGSRRYFDRRGVPKTPADLVDHNCLRYGGLAESTTRWPFVGPDGPFSVPVHGNLSSNSVETIRAAVLAGMGIGLITRTSISGELEHPDVITVLDEFMDEPRDVNLVWPKRRLVPARVRRVTDYFKDALPSRM